MSENQNYYRNETYENKMFYKNKGFNFLDHFIFGNIQAIPVRRPEIINAKFGNQNEPAMKTVIYKK